MIQEIHANALQTDYDLIAHQVNCKGVMGAGIARQIKRDLLPLPEFEKYKTRCIQYGSKNMGTIQILNTMNGTLVANMFAQDDWNARVRQTDYESLKQCFVKLVEYVSQRSSIRKITIPGMIGCGLAGGDWNVVRDEIIKPIFEKEDKIELTIAYYDQKLFEQYVGRYQENEQST